MLRVAPSAPKNPHPQKIRVLRAAPSAPSAPQKSPPLKKSECSKLLRVLPKKLSSKNPHPQNPSCSELLRVLKKSYRQKIHHPQKIRVLRAAPSAPKKAIAPKSPHHFFIAPRHTTHYLCFQKSQISHVHKHNAFQFRLRNRNISSS